MKTTKSTFITVSAIYLCMSHVYPKHLQHLIDSIPTAVLWDQDTFRCHLCRLLLSLWKTCAGGTVWIFIFSPPLLSGGAIWRARASCSGFRCSTWLGCNAEERKMAAYLITGVKRLWRRQKSRTPWEKTSGGITSMISCKVWSLLNLILLLYSYLRYDIMHVTSGVIGAIIVAKAVHYRLRFKLVFVCD